MSYQENQPAGNAGLPPQRSYYHNNLDKGTSPTQSIAGRALIEELSVEIKGMEDLIGRVEVVAARIEEPHTDDTLKSGQASTTPQKHAPGVLRELDFAATYLRGLRKRLEGAVIWMESRV